MVSGFKFDDIYIYILFFTIKYLMSWMMFFTQKPQYLMIKTMVSGFDFPSIQNEMFIGTRLTGEVGPLSERGRRGGHGHPQLVTETITMGCKYNFLCIYTVCVLVSIIYIYCVCMYNDIADDTYE